MSSELNNFDWFNFKSTAPDRVFMPEIISIIDAKNESQYDRKMRMLKQLSNTCVACSMCELGLSGAERNNTIRDPHVLSNMNPAKFFVVGQNPGWEELEKRQPFVGAAGKNFDTEIIKYGIDRSWFYICNTVRCFTPGNAKPTDKSVSRCEPFLQMEINLIKPYLIITLGAVAFDRLCPGIDYSSALGKITKSSKYNTNVFAIYHPSPVNFRDSSRKVAFANQIRVMCKLVKAIKDKYAGQSC